jgi:probable FeS assembly SUF system protein SufT
MRTNKPATVTRDVEAREIPSGIPVTLKTGEPVVLTQALGGSYTVMTQFGFMARVDGKDGDAIGEEIVTFDPAAAEGKTTEELCWEQLRTCYDPEIPVNIVDLGLVYRCEAQPLPEGGEKVTVHFTLTAPGCGMGDYLKQDVQRKLEGLPGVKETDVQVVFEPAWEQSMMSEAARLQLGLM